MPSLPVEAIVRHLPGAAVVALNGEIDGLAEEVLNGAYAQAGEAGAKAIILDLREVHYINSKGIALLVVLIMRARQDGRRILAFGLCEHFLEIFAITRLSDYIDLFDDERGAVAAIAWQGPAVTDRNRGNHTNGTLEQAKA